MGAPDKATDKNPLRGVVKHLEGRQATSQGKPLQAGKDKDPHALVGAPKTGGAGNAQKLERGSDGLS